MDVRWRVQGTCVAGRLRACAAGGMAQDVSVLHSLARKEGGVRIPCYDLHSEQHRAIIFTLDEYILVYILVTLLVKPQYY